MNDLEHGAYLADTLRDEEAGKENCREMWLKRYNQIYKMMRPGEPYSEEIASTVFNRTFFSQETYDLFFSR